MAAEEDSADLVVVNSTVTEAILVVFHVADGSLLGSGFSASYSGPDQGGPHEFLLIPLWLMTPGQAPASQHTEAQYRYPGHPLQVVQTRPER